MLTLKQFLELSHKEKEDLAFLERLVREKKQKALIANCSRIALSQLIRFTEASAILDDLLKTSDYSTIWEKQLEDYFTLDDRKFQLRHYPPFTPYQIAKGEYYSYKAADVRWYDKQRTPFTEAELEFLQQSVKYECCCAIEQLIYYYCKHQNPHDSLTISSILNLLKFAEKHWTPGYILIARTYRFLARQLDDECYGIKALSAILMARDLAMDENSKKAINNAYCGETLDEHYKINDWDKAIQHFSSSLKLSPVKINKAYELYNNRKEREQIPTQTNVTMIKNPVTLTL